MNYKKTIGILVVIISIASLVASYIGIFSSGGEGKYVFSAITGESVDIFGKGIYHKDSVATATQAISQDIVTLLVGIPLLLISFIYASKNNLRGKLLLVGTLGYFLYTYASYSFLAMFNELFLVYVLIMSCSFFSFILSIQSIDHKKLLKSIKKQFPTKFVGIFIIMFSILICMMWLGRIVPSITNETPPSGLDHYSTLIIQALDLGILVPVSFIAGALLLQKRPYGYLLSAIVIIKSMTLSTAVTAMVIGQYIAGIKLEISEIIAFPILNIITIYCLIMILKNIREPESRLKA